MGSYASLLVPLLFVPLLMSACDSAGERALARVQMDTLDNGAVRVVNPAQGLWALSETEPWEVREDLRIGVVEGDPR